jgi:hypothetical protein
MPFKDVVKDLQSKRKDHLPGSIENLLYKEMGNSLYGSVTRGMSNKMNYDVQLGRTIRMECTDLSNPILAS